MVTEKEAIIVGGSKTSPKVIQRVNRITTVGKSPIMVRKSSHNISKHKYSTYKNVKKEINKEREVLFNSKKDNLNKSKETDVTLNTSNRSSNKIIIPSIVSVSTPTNSNTSLIKHEMSLIMSKNRKHTSNKSIKKSPRITEKSEDIIANKDKPKKNILFTKLKDKSTEDKKVKQLNETSKRINKTGLTISSETYVISANNPTVKQPTTHLDTSRKRRDDVEVKQEVKPPRISTETCTIKPRISMETYVKPEAMLDSYSQLDLTSDITMKSPAVSNVNNEIAASCYGNRFVTCSLLAVDPENSSGNDCLLAVTTLDGDRAATAEVALTEPISSRDSDCMIVDEINDSVNDSNACLLAATSAGEVSVTDVNGMGYHGNDSLSITPDYSSLGGGTPDATVTDLNSGIHDSDDSFSLTQHDNGGDYLDDNIGFHSLSLTMDDTSEHVDYVKPNNSSRHGNDSISLNLDDTSERVDYVDPNNRCQGNTSLSLTPDRDGVTAQTLADTMDVRELSLTMDISNPYSREGGYQSDDLISEHSTNDTSRNRSPPETPANSVAPFVVDVVPASSSSTTATGSTVSTGELFRSGQRDSFIADFNEELADVLNMSESFSDCTRSRANLTAVHRGLAPKDRTPKKIKPVIIDIYFHLRGNIIYNYSLIKNYNMNIIYIYIYIYIYLFLNLYLLINCIKPNNYKPKLLQS